MALSIKSGKCNVVIYDWRSKYDSSKLTNQERYKLTVIELNEMYRNGKESPVSDQEYDHISSLITDEEFKLATGTGLGAEFVPEYLRNRSMTPEQKEIKKQQLLEELGII